MILNLILYIIKGPIVYPACRFLLEKIIRLLAFLISMMNLSVKVKALTNKKLMSNNKKNKLFLETSEMGSYIKIMTNQSKI